MADISAIFFILLILGVAFPAVLAAGWLLFPALTGRAQACVERTPWRTFWLGIALLLALAIPVVILLALPFGPAKFLGWLLLVGTLAVSSLGSAGIAAHLGSRLSGRGSFTPLNAYLRGAVILELAAFFPIIGWLFIWIPMLIVALGATALALLHREPGTAPRPAPASLPTQA